MPISTWCNASLREYQHGYNEKATQYGPSFLRPFTNLRAQLGAVVSVTENLVEHLHHGKERGPIFFSRELGNYFQCRRPVLRKSIKHTIELYGTVSAGSQRRMEAYRSTNECEAWERKSLTEQVLALVRDAVTTCIKKPDCDFLEGGVCEVVCFSLLKV